MPTLSLAEYELVYAMLSLTVASMGAAAIFFFFGRSQVGAKYRPALLVSGIVVGIACYHYARIFGSWQEAYTLTEAGTYVASGVPFLDSYRYADWLLTVPLLLVELVSVLALAKERARPLIAKLAIAAVAMIALGYPGEVSEGLARHAWGWASSVPFAYILWVLWGELGQAIERQPENVKGLVKNIRLLLLATWGVYPIAYLIGALGVGGGAVGEVGLQVGYSVADITAKAGFGLMIYAIARAKTTHDLKSETTTDDAPVGELAAAAAE